MSQSRKGKKGSAEPPEIEKPPDSPVSPLLFRGRGSSSSTATTSSSSSSSSSGSGSGRNGPNPRSDLPHSGEARGFKPANAKSPALLPGGNIFPSGKVLTTGMAKRDTKSNVLGSGTTNYGYGSIMRGRGPVPGPGRDNITKPKEDFKKKLEKHIKNCSDARRNRDWRSVLNQADSVISLGSDKSPHLFACKAEALLNLSELDQAQSTLSQITQTNSHTQWSNFFGMISDAYLFFVRAQVELARGRFENAVSAVEKARQIDANNVEISLLLTNLRLVSQAGIRGNRLFKSQRYTEACAAYEDGLCLDPSNPVLYYNRAACWYKMGEWEKSINDCNQALHIHPNYTKALLRRAASKMKLELWAEAVRDYEVLSRELPHDNEVAESLMNARAALLKKSNNGEEDEEEEEEVEIVSGVEQFRAAILLCPGVSVLYFKAASNVQCWEISAFLDKLRTKYPSINFLKVDVEDCPLIANAENVRNVPTFKIYNKGQRVKDLVCPSPHELEALVRNYCI